MRRPRLAQICFPICVVALALSGCGSNFSSMNSSTPAGPTGPAPVVAAMGVETNGVAPNRWIYAQFNEAMDPATINRQTFTVADAGGKLVTGNVAYYANYDVAGFQPSPVLQQDATYTVTLSTGVASAQGVHLASAYTDSLTTRASSDTSPITVTSVSPAPNATCVSATAPITITFNEGADVSTVNSTNITITGPNNEAIAAQISYDVATAVVTLTPSAPLPSGNITVTVQNVSDAAGVPMPSAYVWSFDTNCSPGSTVAYVYVSDFQAFESSKVVAYAADANGQLTPVPGSPFNDNVSSLSVDGKYLMASSSSEPDINSYEIESNGALTSAAQTNYDQYGSGCATVSGSVSHDRTGQSVYVDADQFNCADNLGTASFAIDASTGSLSYLGGTVIGYNASGISTGSFLGNDIYAYSGFPDCMYGNITAFQRSSSGLLKTIHVNVDQPASPPPPPNTSFGGYGPGPSVADSTNHVVFAEYPCFGQFPVQFATYTADANGNLSTTDSYKTMPSTPIDVLTMKLSPSGTLFAVAGWGGVQVFHFNGTNPITPDTNVFLTDLPTNNYVSNIAWDKNNHLYVITKPAEPAVTPSKLYVFTITDTGAHQAPGSPYTLANPADIAVKPTW